MTTWAWKCDAVEDDGAGGTGPDYETVVAAAAAHNADAEHAQPSITYSNDDPTPEDPPVPPTAIDLFNAAATAIAEAADFDAVKVAFAQLQTDIAPFVTPPLSDER